LQEVHVEASLHTEHCADIVEQAVQVVDADK
jgi:hypothetical protein